MSGSSSILPFCPTDTGTNLLTDASYLAASDRTNGNQPGIASQRLVNKALRQSSLVAAGVAQWMANRNNTTVGDTASVNQMETWMNNAITAATPGRLITIRIFTSSQTYTPTNSSVNVCVFLVVGGGGAGGGGNVPPTGMIQGGPGGAGGGATMGSGSVATFNGQYMTVGAAGVGQVAGSGTAGGTSSIGSILSATGGQPGGLNGPQTAGQGIISGGGGPGGLGTGGFFNWQGGFGQWATYSTNGVVNGGQGGFSYFGSGGRWSDMSIGGWSAGVYGAGGGGCALASNTGPTSGGNGGQGVILVWEYS